ncbi:MAG: low-specificity L-threonine aldolase [Rhodospirillales bacterium]|nr:low-specificity L-threonine aldolase [Rhodospirillales bacterium]
MRSNSPITYDFRSDTVTRPSAGMRRAMAEAEVGDDVYGDDPTTNRLEAVMAERLGKDKALYLPSGTQSNLAGLMAHCGRGDEYIVGQGQHTYRWEAGGAAVLGSIQPQPIVNQPDGTLALADIEAAIKPDDSHYAMTRLLALENTIGGRVIPMAYIHEATALARRHGLGCHLDGARAFNASVALGIPIAELVAPFDTISICLSKGLGAPVGSVLVGNADLIDRARRVRKMLGGGMRQVGILAAAGLYALEHNVERLAEDHANAKELARQLCELPGVTANVPDTNIVFATIDQARIDGLADHLQSGGIGVNTTYDKQRWVTHMDVDGSAIAGAMGHLKTYFH